MTAGRRHVRVEDTSAWVFNRMADVYDARPAYPPALVDAVVELATMTGPRVADIGAGTGHLALPLAERGLDVVAIEPAESMLARLRVGARARGVTMRALHGAAEALPLADDSVDLAIVSDALHFLNAEVAAREVSRVLARRRALAIITCELGDTPFMRSVERIMEDCAPRRPREVVPAITQFLSLAKVRPGPVRIFQDETPVSSEALERILRSISFIGPAMNPERFAAFRRRVLAVPAARIWARTLALYAGIRRPAARRTAK